MAILSARVAILPNHLSSLTRWRARIGVEGVDIDGVRILRPHGQPFWEESRWIASARHERCLRAAAAPRAKPAFRGG